MNSNYSIVIQWSTQNNCFIASLPEWKNCNAKGKTYEEALDNARKAISFLVKSSVSEGKPLPETKVFQLPSANQQGVDLEILTPKKAY